MSAVETSGGDEQLAGKARELAQRWLTEAPRYPPEIVQAVLNTAAYHGDAVLHSQLLAGRIPIRDALDLFGSGYRSPRTRQVPFEFVKAHFDQLMAGNPSIQGQSLGAMLPSVGRSFCDAASRQQLVAFFAPLAERYDGLQRNLDQTRETMDQCLALVEAQSASVKEFLEKY